jgi:hypothetical protein
VKLISWSDYDMAEQIQLMCRTRAMISLPGSDIMNGIFLRDQGAFVLYCRHIGGGTGRDKLEYFDTSNERTYWFDKLPYVDTTTEDCNSTNVSYSKTPNADSSITYVDFASLKLRLQRLGIRH